MGYWRRGEESGGLFLWRERWILLGVLVLCVVVAGLRIWWDGVREVEVILPVEGTGLIEVFEKVGGMG